MSKTLGNLHGALFSRFEGNFFGVNNDITRLDDFGFDNRLRDQ
jgi:hypothetical protein